MDVDADDPHGNYDDSNRAFLQAFMSRGQLSLEEGKKMLAAIFTVQSSESRAHPSYHILTACQIKM